MKNIFITALFALLVLQTNTLRAQDENTSVVRNGLGLSLAPLLTMPSFVNQSNYASNYTKGGFGATAALCENIVLSKKQGFYLYLELGYQTTAFIDQFPIIYVTGTGQGANANAKFLNRQNNGIFSLSIQKVLFKIGSKAGIFLGIGAQASYLFSTTETVATTDLSGHTTTSSYSNTSISPDAQWSAYGVARLGLMLTPVKHFSINVAPVFYYGLNPQFIFTKNQPGYNSLGLNVQFIYNFK